MTHSTKRRPRLAGLVLLASLATSSNALSQESLRETIQARQNEWASAFNREDTPELARLYEQGAILVPPGGEPVVGRSKILDVLTSLYSQIDELALYTEDVTRLGEDHAVEIGHNTYYSVQDDGSVTRRADNYMVVWRMDESGTWRYLREILNPRATGSDRPSP